MSFVLIKVLLFFLYYYELSNRRVHFFLYRILLSKRKNSFALWLFILYYKICCTGLTDSREFEKMASDVLSICYLQNRYQSHQLLVRKLNEFGNTTLFSLAEENRLMEFMGLTCCQANLNAIWKGEMVPSTSIKKVWNCEMIFIRRGQCSWVAKNYLVRGDVMSLVSSSIS